MDKYLRVFITLNEKEAQDTDYVRYPKKLFTILLAGTPNKEEKVQYLMGSSLKLALSHGISVSYNDIDMAIQFAKAMDFNSWS